MKKNFFTDQRVYLDEYAQCEAAAHFSVDWRHRFSLWRDFGRTGDRTLHFIMLNPSTANALRDDQTIRCCVAIAKHNGYGRIIVTNLHSFVTRSPSSLKSELLNTSEDASKRELNLAVSMEAISLSHTTVLTWGAHGELGGAGVAIG